MFTRLLSHQVRKLPRKRFYTTSRKNIWNREQMNKNVSIAYANKSAKSLVEEYSKIFKTIEEHYLVVDGRVNIYMSLFDNFESHSLKRPEFIFPDLSAELLNWWTRSDIPEEVKFQSYPKIGLRYSDGDGQVSITFGEMGKKYFTANYEFNFTKMLD